MTRLAFAVRPALLAKNVSPAQAKKRRERRALAGENAMLVEENKNLDFRIQFKVYSFAKVPVFIDCIEVLKQDFLILNK